jgi:phytoene synthase
MKNYSYSRNIAAKSGSNFYLSFYFLPAAKRNAIFAVYAFSRLVDDAVDEAPDPETARREIALWRQRLSACYHGGGGGDLSHPLLPELSDAISRFHIPESYFSDLLVGVEMDLSKKQYATFAELEKYCYHVAGTIGLLCNHLFGLPDDERGKKYALFLGTAFQLTNIIRDVGVDALLGRVYLPADELKKFGITEDDILNRRTPDGFLSLMRFQSLRAAQFFRKAEEALPLKERKKIIPAEIMSAFYQKILNRLQKENFPVFEKKVSLSKGEKFALMFKTVARSFL